MDEPLILDRYRLIERLATGGSAEVWRAHDEQLDRPVAVKRLHAHLLPDESSRKRLAAEARAAAQLSHPVIVGIYDVDTEGDLPAIVMELVEGESLASRIAREGPLGPAHAAQITADLADALYHAHQRGLVHRDVKPGNVLLDAEGRTRLVDFGIAHSLAVSAERLTLTGNVVGTLSAMAPEQLVGGAISPRTDLYGLGAVLHEALTGRPPYAGAASPVGLADAQRTGPPPLDGVDAPLAALVAACLAYRPEDRPLHAGALAKALRAWMAGEPSPIIAMAPTARHSAVVDTGAATMVRSVTPVAQPHRSNGFSRRIPALILGAMGAAVAVSVVIALIWLGESPAVGDSATPSPSSAVPAVAATPPPELSGWARKLTDDYEEECDRPFDPATIEGMSKRDAEAVVEPQIEACEEAREDDDDD